MGVSSIITLPGGGRVKNIKPYFFHQDFFGCRDCSPSALKIAKTSVVGSYVE